MSLLAIIASQKRRLDPDSTAYANAVAAAGGTVSGDQRAALSLFVAGEKAAGRWASLKRLYLPIWGAAAANAIDLATLATGSWVGGVTHAAGYAEGNGSTGYFNTGVSPATLGFTLDAFGQGFLTVRADTRNETRVWGGSLGATEQYLGLMTQNATQLRSVSYSSSTRARVWSAAAATDQIGIFEQTRVGGSDITYRRHSGGFAAVDTVAVAAGGTGIPAANHYFFALNQGGTATVHTNARLGAYWLDTGFGSATAVEAFTLNIKTLWESLTGLSLP